MAICSLTSVRLCYAQAKWVAPIITEIPTDAWENQLLYTVSGNTYEIRSGGVDGQVNTDDDITVEGS